MAKRFAITLLIVLACALFLSAGFVLVLVLAPGLSVFGLKYIARDTHPVHKETTIQEVVGGFDGSLIIEAYECPVIISYSEIGGISGYAVEYHNNYQGFTTSDYEDPSVSIIKDDFGNVVISVKEYQKFVYESSSSSRYLKVSIPLNLTSSGYLRYATNLTINAEKSTVTFEKFDTSDERTPSFNTVSVKTNGKLQCNTGVLATTFKFETKNKIVVPSDRSSFIDAENYELESYNGAIEIYGGVSGNVSAKTSDSNIRLLSCKNLTVETTDGSVFTSKDGESITVNGVVNIKTTSGSVYLGKINGIGNNVISTSSGKVEVEKFNDGEISTNLGNVFVKSSKNINVKSNLGKVEINEILESSNIETVRGNIVVGGDNLPVGDLKAYSLMGRIEVLSLNGKAELETANGNINLNNTDSNDITIKCGGKLVADGLTGKVNIASEGNVSLTFELITDETRVELGDGVGYALIKAVSNSASRVKYYIAGKKVVRYEVNGTETDSKIEDKENIDNSSSTGPLFKVTGENAYIDVYFKD